ncbi:MAG TPA: hypothetical protein VLK23_05100 [Thermodesulfobacteriota bacterium]|nr:hypothetical protein [Thermodesulfobacteriota bacterium]
MAHTEILEQIKKLSLKERLEVIDAAIHLLRDELTPRVGPLTPEDRKRLLSKGADALLKDYETDRELTSFTALDGEDFHAQG